MSKRTSRKPRKKRKIRTRDHVIADLSFHHVTGPILRAGFTIEVPRVDYGIDAHVETFTAEGLAENGTIFLQLKATDNISTYRVENGDLSFPMDTRDLDYWAKEPFPTYLILYDAKADVAFWLYIQNYLETEGIDVATIPTKSVSFRIPAAQTVQADTPGRWRQHKSDVISNMARIPHV
jgi:Domain of unknown function (DUF4365)